jgi:tRNA threonylcarbamoyladenosine biosynthesis protein TsaE
LAAGLCAGDLVCLFGELGAGKTTFIQGLAQGLRVPDWVTSPSFTILHDHQAGPPGAGKLRFCHLDLYRLGKGDLDDIGLDELLGSEAVVAVEWAERLPAALRSDALEVVIAFDQAEEKARHIRVRASGPRGKRMLDALSEEKDADPRL